jgi:transposase-like protein
MKAVSEFCCLNDGCPAYGKKGAGNIVVHYRYSKHDKIRMLKCKTCGVYFSERKNTVLYNCKMPEDKALEIIHHLSKGCGIRKTCRLTGASRDAVSRLARKADLNLREAQF